MIFKSLTIVTLTTLLLPSISFAGVKENLNNNFKGRMRVTIAMTERFTAITSMQTLLQLTNTNPPFGGLMTI